MDIEDTIGRFDLENPFENSKNGGNDRFFNVRIKKRSNDKELRDTDVNFGAKVMNECGKETQENKLPWGE